MELEEPTDTLAVSISTSVVKVSQFTGTIGVRVVLVDHTLVHFDLLAQSRVYRGLPYLLF